jgi:hypothetical protein
VVIYDEVTNTPLVRGLDFQCVELLQEATLKYGQEISGLVLVINPLVSSKIRVSYQTLGGLYQYDASGIVQMYETVMRDNRPIAWTDVLNKPLEYPPSLHNHVLDDVYGFEYVVVALERIRNAIILSDVPAFEALVDWIRPRLLTPITIENMDRYLPGDVGAPPDLGQHVITYDALLHFIRSASLCRLEILVVPNSTMYSNGDIVTVKLKMSCIPTEADFYWTISHIDTTPADFDRLSGRVSVVGKEGIFRFQILEPVGLDGVPKHFRIEIRRNSIISKVVAKSVIIEVNSISMIDYLTGCCLFNPSIDINPESMFVMKEGD